MTTKGHREILGKSVSLSEAEVHRCEFFASAHAPGMYGLRMINSDDHAEKRPVRPAFPASNGCQTRRSQPCCHRPRRAAITSSVSRTSVRRR
ncbi:MAG: hypothetical protein IPK58_13860 [Acidobacteria bacterium]|nr:hypothetical protein [Acidobacteriota bacterium]